MVEELEPWASKPTGTRKNNMKTQPFFINALI
jgi:hypothetical protein